ncbi:hypothetical protein L7F22_063874 [Adiantum nelumboides]|nr:hypothetical protein [Adiantum nelumboides]
MLTMMHERKAMATNLHTLQVRLQESTMALQETNIAVTEKSSTIQKLEDTFSHLKATPMGAREQKRDLSSIQTLALQGGAQEPKTLTHDSDGDICYASNLYPTLLVAMNSSYEQDKIVDSRASFHVTPHKEWFSSYESRHGMVRLGNNYACDIIGAGDIKLSLPNDSIFTLTNVRHVPKLAKSLISTGQLDDARYHTTFGNQSRKLYKGSLVVMRGNKCGTLYPLHVSGVHNHVVVITEEPSVSLWHRRLGHMSQTRMEYLPRFKYIPVFDFFDFSTCEYCMFGKQNKSSHSRRGSHKSEHLELVHSDVCGPMPVLFLGGALYFVTFIDDATRKVWVYTIKRKDEVFATFQKFLALVENQSGKKLRCLRTDNGGEYVSHTFQEFCDAKGIKRELTAPFNPEQNGVVERMNRTIQERVRCMISNAGLPQLFWGEAVKIAVHLINRSPSKVLDGGVPEEAWTGKPPSYAHLRVFGCEAYVYVPKEQRDKLDPKSRKCIFVGYGNSGEMGYKL